MQLIDSHTHLYADEFKEDIDLVIKQAVTQGISKFFLPNIDSKSINGLIELCGKYPQNCFPMMGLHPCSVNETFKNELELIQNELSKRTYYAIGETGIDLYWDKTFIEEQKEAFRTQIKWSLELNLPIVIHCRQSFKEIIDVLKELYNNSQKQKGIFHCFSGTIEEAKQVIELGFLLGIGGVVTFKNSGLDKVIAEIPLDHIVLETDSPYLAPVPFRGKRNESSYLIHIAEKIASIKNTTLEQVAEITTQNAMKIFGISF